MFSPLGMKVLRRLALGKCATAESKQMWTVWKLAGINIITKLVKLIPTHIYLFMKVFTKCYEFCQSTEGIEYCKMVQSEMDFLGIHIFLKRSLTEHCESKKENYLK